MRVILCSFALGLACTWANALEVRELTQACNSKHREDAALCSGYIMGHLDGRAAMGSWRPKNKDCSAPALPYSKLAEIVLADLRSARRDDWPAGAAIKDILDKRFPCIRSAYE